MNTARIAAARVQTQDGFATVSCVLGTTKLGGVPSTEAGLLSNLRTDGGHESKTPCRTDRQGFGLPPMA